ncbi:SAM-dependent methyltransferase [Rugosimonospora acidiphila]|uniref:SAM-dependent methyltransferase n=1 Tax=Rugosimonospora acidiphila TaxID=556531 RepID=UPI0031EE3752
MDTSAAHPRGLHPRIDTSVAHPARRYDYLLGGKDNFAADRESADRLIEAFPTMRTWAMENRAFLRRAVTHLAGEAGIRQFLDIGTGIPTSPNTHEIAQGIAPDARVVYVDNDPIVLAHARALLSSTPEGATAYLDADLHKPHEILAHPELRGTLDLSQPVALMLVAVLHFIPDSDDPHGLIAPLIQALAPGSYLVLSHVTYDFVPRETADRLNQIVGSEPFRARSTAEFATFFDGLDPVDPGVVPVQEWRAEHEPQPRPTSAEVGGLAGIARIG